MARFLASLLSAAVLVCVVAVAQVRAFDGTSLPRPASVSFDAIAGDSADDAGAGAGYDANRYGYDVPPDFAPIDAQASVPSEWLVGGPTRL